MARIGIVVQVVVQQLAVNAVLLDELHQRLRVLPLFLMVSDNGLVQIDTIHGRLADKHSDPNEIIFGWITDTVFD